MKKASWSLFTYPVMDIKAAEALLNRRAAEGWRYVGFVPKRQRAGGFIESVDLVFERRRPDT